MQVLLAERFPKGQREFIRQAEPGRAIDSAQGYLSKVLAGTKPPPMDRIEAWATALGLTGADRERFIDLAAIAHLPAEVQPRFVDMLNRMAHADERERELAREVVELSREVRAFRRAAEKGPGYDSRR